MEPAASSVEERPCIDLMSCPDAVFGVFRCLEAPADLARSACVSRVWRDVVCAPLLWHALLEAEHRAAAHPDLASSRETSRSKVDASPCCYAYIRELLQPRCDVLGRPAAQLRRWLGVRSLQHRLCAQCPFGAPAPPLSMPRRLDSVQGSRAALDAASQTMVVFDQRQQRLMFVPLERAAAAAMAEAEAADEECGVRVTSVPPLPAQHLQQRQARTRNIWVDWAGEDEGAVAGPEDLEAGELQPPVGGAEVTPGEVADLGGGGFDVLVSCAGDSGDAGACGGGVNDNQQSLPGSGFVATGHPDGRVLVWDAARAAAVGRLPSMQGCGRGPVLALAAASMCSPASGGTAEDVEEDSGVAASFARSSSSSSSSSGAAGVAGTKACRRTLLAVAYRAEVLVWSLPLPEFSPASVAASAAASIPSDAVVGTLPSARLEAIIKPTLDTAVRSMALSGRHGVLALRSSDGVELRSVRRAEAGRWLHGFRDRRNTALLCLGDLLFVASSSPSFMMAATSAPPPPPPAASPAPPALGAMEAAGAAADVHVEDGEAAARPLGPGVCAAAWSCDFQLEVSAVDLGALVARCGGGGGGGGGLTAASAGEAGPVVFDGVAPAAAGAAGAGSGAPARGERPVVVRTTSPAQRCRLTAEEASRILWDQPLQVCATGGFLVVRCLQFDASQQQPAQVQLLWPGLFAFPMGDLVSGLQLGGLQRQPQPNAPRHDGAQAAAAEHALPSGPRDGSAPAASSLAGPAHQQPRAQPQPPAAPAHIIHQAGASGASGARVGAAADGRGAHPRHAEAVAALRGLNQQAADGGLFHAPAAAAAGASSAPPTPQPQAAAGVLIRRTVQPRVLCSSASRSGKLPPSLQLLAAPRSLVLVTPEQEVWLQLVPYTQPFPSEQ